MSDPGGDRTKAVLLNNNGTEVTSYSPNSLHWIVDEFGHEYIQRWKYVRQEHTHLGPCLTPSEIAQREREAELRGREAERTLISAQTAIKQEREKLDQELYGFSEAIAVLARNADKPELTIVAVRRLYAELSRRIRDAECPEATALRAELAQRRAKETQTP